MDWQFKVGLGVAIVFGLLPFGAKNLPNWVTWPGVSIGILFIIWGILPGHQKIPNGPAILFIVCIAGIVGSIAWYNTINQRLSKTQIISKLILSVKDIEITDPKAELTMNLLFNNDGTKEYIIDNLFMITPGNSMSTLGDNDNLLNNFNGKVKLEYKLADGTIVYPAGYYGVGAIKSDFPRVLKVGELYPLQINIPFKVNEFLKEKKLLNIKKIPIGLIIWAINYKGQKYEITTYPIAELYIINDNEINGLYYKSQTMYNYEIEKCNKFPSRVKSVTISPGPGGVVVIPPPPANTDVFEIKIK